MHDGDMVNGISVLSNEANQECAAYLNSPQFIVDPEGTPMLGMTTDLCTRTMYNLTRRRKAPAK